MNAVDRFPRLQGSAAGIMLGLIFTIIGDVFSPAERGKYQRCLPVSGVSASIFGPTLGRWLTIICRGDGRST